MVFMLIAGFLAVDEDIQHHKHGCTLKGQKAGSRRAQHKQREYDVEKTLDRFQHS